MRVMSTCLSTLFGAQLSRSDRKAFGYPPLTPEAASVARSAFSRSLRYAETPCVRAGFASEGLSVVTATLGFMAGTSFAEDRAGLVAAAPGLRRLFGRAPPGGVGRVGAVFAPLGPLQNPPPGAPGRGPGPGP